MRLLFFTKDKNERREKKTIEQKSIHALFGDIPINSKEHTDKQMEEKNKKQEKNIMKLHQ